MTQQSGHSRRTFIKTASAGAAAVGAAVALPSLTSPADAATPAETGALHDGAFTVWVKDAGTGEIAVLAGEREVVHHDKALAAKLARLAAHAAKS